MNVRRALLDQICSETGAFRTRHDNTFRLAFHKWDLWRSMVGLVPSENKSSVHFSKNINQKPQNVSGLSVKLARGTVLFAARRAVLGMDRVRAAIGADSSAPHTD